MHQPRHALTANQAIAVHASKGQPRLQLLCHSLLEERKKLESSDFLSQEVLLILEECWNNSPELQNVPIYQASGLARRAISVYQTYIEMMNDDIKAAFQVRLWAPDSLTLLVSNLLIGNQLHSYVPTCTPNTSLLS